MDYRASFSLNRRTSAFFGARAVVPCDSGMKKPPNLTSRFTQRLSYP
jgi:hypothetical protein